MVYLYHFEIIQVANVRAIVDAPFQGIFHSFASNLLQLMFELLMIPQLKHMPQSKIYIIKIYPNKTE